VISERAIALYNRTLRRVGPVHRIVRSLVWSGGDALVALLQALRGFELPTERLLPFYKIEMLVGTYERDTIRVCERVILPGSVVVDIGAHVGYFSVIFSQLTGPSGRVFAFEPHSGNYEILCRNLRRRGLLAVEAIPMAVSDRVGEEVLHQTPLSMGHTLFNVKEHVIRAPVKTTSLDAFLEGRNIRDPNLVKIDVEGAEPEVLAGLNRLAGRALDLSLVLEFKPSLLRARGHPPSGLLAQLFGLGFDVSVIESGGTLTHVPFSEADAFAAASGTRNLLARKRSR